MKRKNDARSQAQRIIDKFGSPYRMALSLTQARRATNPKAPAVAVSTVYRWTYPRGPITRGTGGFIPTRMVQTVKDAARREGIFLTEEDWYPGAR